MSRRDMNIRQYSKIAIVWVVALWLSEAGMAQTNLFRNADVDASSNHSKYPAKNVVDGAISRKSTWMSASDSRPPHVLELTLPRYCDIDSVVIYTGIPENEKNEGEKGQTAGFWNMKNFIIQYWDDANWTDISETMTTENRLDRIVFRFPSAITSFRFRLVSSDGEPIRIIELEGYGRVNGLMAPPVMNNADNTLPSADRRTGVFVKFKPEVVGKTMKYVGYNQGYYLPGYNASGWLEYSNVNAVRVWAELNTYVSRRWIDTLSTVSSLGDFERLKARFLENPESREFIQWDSIAQKAAEPVSSTNSMVFDYALDELKKLGIDVLVQSGMSKERYTTTWQNKWELWQSYYALAFYAAKRGDVEMFAMKNEPNHRNAGPMPLDTYIELMRITSDAIHQAVGDVNRLYGKELKPRFVGPVTAGTNTNWWAKIAASEMVDYRGEKCDKDQVDIFSTHSYNLPAAGYVSKVQSIDGILRRNHPEGRTKPIVFTEIGRWMNAYLIDKEETMDSPSLFTEWAGIYTNNMLGGGYGMWAFKFANTRSSTYPRGIKSGHHFVWKGKRFAEDAYENLAFGKSVTACGTDMGSDVARVTDGDKSDASAWTFTSDDPKWVEIDLEKEQQLGGIAIYTGSSYGVFTAPDRVRSLSVEAWNGSEWTSIEDASDENSRYAQVYYTFEKPVVTSKIRVNLNDKGKVMLREVKLFGPNTLSAAEESYDVSGVQRTAQVVRLFAKGFKEQRPLLKSELSVRDADLDVCASMDSLSGNMYVWLVQRNPVNYNMVIDMRELGVKPGTPVVYEQVSDRKYGEAALLRTSENGLLVLTLPGRSVGLLTLRPGENTTVRSIFADKCAVVRGGSEADRHQPVDQLSIEMNARTGEKNSVSYIHFDLEDVDLEKAGRIVLGVHGACDTGEIPFRFHVYCMEQEAWKNGRLTWNEAPALAENEARAVGVGVNCFVAGELAVDAYADYHRLDVTEVVKRHMKQGVTFMLVRELREPGDDYDNGRVAVISAAGSDQAPVLEIW